VVATPGSNGCGLGSDVAFHILIQIIFDFGLFFPIFLLLTSLLYLLCKTLVNWALRSFSHGGLCWFLGEDNEQCTLLVVASDWYVACFCLFHHFTHLSSCCSRHFCEMSTASDDGTETYAFALEKHSMVAMAALLASYVLAFVFSITSFISACVATDIFVKYLLTSYFV
jgi:hypothetical protein